MRRSYVGELSLHRSWDYEHRLPGDVSPSRASSPRVLALRPEKTALGCAERHLGHIGVGPAHTLPLPVSTQQAPPGAPVDVALCIDAPRRKTREQKQLEPLSEFALLFNENRFPEPVYFKNVDCMGIPNMLSPEECRGIIHLAEDRFSFQAQLRARVIDMLYLDLVDSTLADALWQSSLGWILRTVKVDGLLPRGIHQVIRIQKFVQGGFSARHIDRPIRLQDQVSKYSLRIFLNEDLEGGCSVFHVPWAEPVEFQPKTGMALVYPQGEMCTVQEEAEVAFGSKYVLRADVIFG